MHLVLTMIVVSATGNHWWLDGIVAMVLLGVALLIDSGVRRLVTSRQAGRIPIDVDGALHRIPRMTWRSNRPELQVQRRWRTHSALDHSGDQIDRFVDHTGDGRRQPLAGRRVVNLDSDRR